MNFDKLKYPLSTLPVRILDAVNIHLPSKTPVHFIIEKGNWSIKWDGEYVTREVNKIAAGTACVDTKPFLLSNKVVHFGSQFQCVSWYKHMAKSNRMICTFFHGKRSDDAGMARHVDEFMESVPYLEKVITAASMIEERLLEWGVPRAKLVRIPIGIDCNLFKPFKADEKIAARRKYGIRDDQLVIGSFQKDGNGWGEGIDPKMIKGPDLLVETIKQVAANRPVFVLLTGPARGYVKKRLDELNIPYAHEYLDDYLELPKRFAPLDVYINASREEGGPKGIMEAMASGVMVVSSKVGMAPDIMVNGRNGILTDVADCDGMAEKIINFADDKQSMEQIVTKARQDILAYDWANIGQQHYDLVYKDML